MFRKVAVGISGGVDSAVTALLLKNRGFDVHGVFMQNWDEFDETGMCSGERDWEDAQWVCQKLHISVQRVSFVKEYWNFVFGAFLREYQSGMTPNPDILCNRHIKFDYFYKFALEKMEVDAIATGHYARNSFGGYLELYRDGQDAKLLKAADKFKDQKFFLSQMPQSALRRTMFPLGAIAKSKVKQMAQENGLDRVARRKESTGICFIGKRSFKDFIAEYIDSQVGKLRDIDTGKIIAEHDGLHKWTIGQRCKISGCLKPYFVARKIPSSNDILIAGGTTHPALFSDIVYTSTPHWIVDSPFVNDNTFLINCQFRFQHTKPLVDCRIFSNANGHLFIKLKTPLRALTPGQYAVIYKDAECLGAAKIIAPGPPCENISLNQMNTPQNSL